MPALLGLLTSVLYGASDFCGGLAARRARLLQVLAGGHLIGLIGIFVASLLIAEVFRWEDFVLGAIGGAFGGLGLALLYRRLAIGPMQVVAPITALLSAAVPATWGIARGEDITGIAAMGIVLGLIAIGLVSTSGHHRHAPVTPLVIVESALAGIGFGLLFIFLDATDAASSPWPVVGGRLLTVVVLVPFLLASGQRIIPKERAALGLIAVTGLFDTGANASFLYATNEGLLSLVSVLSAQYPVVTVLLARVVLAERMTRRQLWGFCAATMATTLIVIG